MFRTVRGLAVAVLSFSLAGSLAVLAGAGDARAGASAWDEDHASQARLVSASLGAGEAESLRLGLEFVMQDDWKVYWRSPGDAGYTTTIDWSGSENLKDVEILWPAPTRFSVLGIETMGYEKRVILPLDIAVERPGEDVRLRAHVDYLVCSDVCIPAEAHLELDLLGGLSGPGAHARDIALFASRVPVPDDAAGLRLREAAEENGLLRLVMASDAPFQALDVFVEGPDGAIFGRPEVRVFDGGHQAVMRLALPEHMRPANGLSGMPVTVTAVDQGRAMETVAEVAPVPALSLPGEGQAASLAVILGLALLGGLILNLMPCVLPVLSLKVLSVVGHGGAARAAVRIGFVASAAGIVFSFLVLAGAAIAVKALGASVGWGIQFQQPAFLVGMVLLLTLFAANLWGLFNVPLPGGLAEGAARKTPDKRDGLSGHFATGAFATLLATPCSAPFLGTAVGFALARGPLEILAVFAALGLGMALPYLLVAAMPGLATRLPRPGPWMITLRRLLGVALAVTAVWLLFVLAAQVSPLASMGVGAAMVLVLGVLLVRRRLAPRLRPVAVGAVAVLAVAAFAVPGRTMPQPPQGLSSDVWVVFEQTAIRSHVAEGRVVFVDVTADWCITCQVNKMAVLDRAPVADLLAGEVVAMRADWTRPDDGIAAYLSDFGRYGIPFNAVYGPGAPDGITLPEVLTERAVMEALKKAEGS